MAATNTVLTAAAANTNIDDNVLNPDVTNATQGNRTIVHVSLVFDGVTFTPDALYDALDAQYGTVASDDSLASRGTYRFVIST